MLWLRYALFSLVIITVIAGLATYVRFNDWRDRHVESLASASDVLRTERGEIEVSSIGVGPAILLVHGRPGGFDQMAGAASLFPADHQRISVSRPGYLRTPITSGQTPEEQANLYVALLDKLNIEKAIVLGVSGGGPSVIRLALDYPERVRAIVLLSARMLTKPKPTPDEDFSIRDILSQDFLVWLFDERLAESLAGDTHSNQLTPEVRSALTRIVMSSVPEAMRASGKDNDLIQLTDPRLNNWSFNKISVPTLIIHGINDTGTDVDEAEYVRDQIPNAELVFLDGGHFIGATHADEVRQIIKRFVARLPAIPAATPRLQFPLASLRQLGVQPQP